MEENNIKQTAQKSNFTKKTWVTPSVEIINAQQITSGSSKYFAEGVLTPSHNYFGSS